MKSPLSSTAQVLSLMALCLVSTPMMTAQQPSTPDDPYIWLEDVTGEKPLGWVREQNAVSTKELEGQPGFQSTRTALLSIYNSKDKIPYVAKYGEFYYNFWQDEQHVRGIWRRTTLAEYRKDNPAWETVLDLDALGTSEKENWVWHGASVLYPDYDLALVSLSRGGADADVVREFNLKTKSFVSPESGGFALPEAKSNVTWRDRDTLYVGTDFGAGSLTDSGYPRIVKLWKRGTPLAEATTIFEAEQKDMAVSGYRAHDHGAHYDMISRRPAFFTNEVYLQDKAGKWNKIDKPDDVTVGLFRSQIILSLRKDWTIGERTYASGSVLTMSLEGYLTGKREFTMLYEPGPRKSLAGMTGTKNYLVINELENVRNKLYSWKLDSASGKWTREAVPAPEFGTTSIGGIDDDESDDVFIQTQDFLTPPSLVLGTIGKPQRETLKSLPAFFDATGMKAYQYEATSADGAKIPYFVVTPKNFQPNGNAPAILYGYGGFQISMVPSYAPNFGKGWIERGGVYVLANIRGGGEFGPPWHQAALREKRQRAYDDFAAVAQDIVTRKITSAAHLGIMGGSNGGLLVGTAFTQRPELYRAVVCQVPLLDMRRYNKLLAGASWMAEYGNPDVPEDWAFIQKYSPYQNVKPASQVKYPRVFFTTSTRDDRVHPAHARKMVALMKALGHDVLYYENIEGGHGGAANAEQRANMWALSFTFLGEELGLK